MFPVDVDPEAGKKGKTWSGDLERICFNDTIRTKRWNQPINFKQLLRQLDHHVVLGSLGSNMRSNSLLHARHMMLPQECLLRQGSGSDACFLDNKIVLPNLAHFEQEPSKRTNSCIQRSTNILVWSSWQWDKSIPTKGRDWLPVCNGLLEDLALKY